MVRIKIMKSDLGSPIDPATGPVEIVRSGPSSSTLRLMAFVGLGAIGLATVAGFSSMAGADTDNERPIVTLGEPKPVTPANGETESVTTPDPIIDESPLDPIVFEQDPDAIVWNGDGEFYCPPCGMG